MRNVVHDGQSSKNAMDDIAVRQMHAGDGDGADMIFTCNDREISVSIFPANGSSTRDSRHMSRGDRPLQDHLIDLVAHITVCDDDNEYEAIQDEVLGVILDAGRPMFSQPATIPKGAPTGQLPCLGSLLFPEILYFRLEATAGRTAVNPIGSRDAYTALTIDPVLDQSIEEDFLVDESLPRHDPQAVLVTEVFLRGLNTSAAVVQVDGRDMFCKARSRPGGLSGTSEGRELDCLGRIRSEFPSSETIRIPQLLGYVCHNETGQVLGFVRQWIPGQRLSDVGAEAASADMRRKWASQIRETVQRLHERGLVWGDGKPSNVIIDDEKQDAWLIGFGTRVWVDEDLAETVREDKQAVAELARLLGP